MSQIAEILIAQARNAAETRRQSGAAWGNAVTDIAQAPAQVIQQKDADAARAQALDLQRRRDARDTQSSTDSHEAHVAELDQMRQRAAGDWADHLIAAGITDPEALSAEVDRQAGKLWKPDEVAAIKAEIATPETAKRFLTKLAPVRQPAKVGTREIKTRNPDGSETIQIVPDTPGASFQSAPEPQKPAPLTFGAPQEVSIGGKSAMIRAGSDGAIYDLNGQKVPASVVAAYHAPKDKGDEPLVAIMKDGKPILVPRSQAVYQTPATNREQGRAVTSGDAGRVAEIDNSLDDIGRLKTAIGGAGSTGTVAKIGASLPNWVTDITGWGTDAKKKQALIDRVKQVIGKALEGGVLRKEDELKYEKILPTVSDVNEVVTEKLNGLNDAIRSKRERLLESLTDAGYETSRFARTEKGATGGAQLQANATQRVVQNGVTYEVTTDATGKVVSSKVVP